LESFEDTLEIASENMTSAKDWFLFPDSGANPNEEFFLIWNAFRADVES